MAVSVVRLLGYSSVGRATDFDSVGPRFESLCPCQFSVVALAQLVEYRIVIPRVTGSSPVRHPKICLAQLRCGRRQHFNVSVAQWQRSGLQNRRQQVQVLPGMPINRVHGGKPALQGRPVTQGRGTPRQSPATPAKPLFVGSNPTLHSIYLALAQMEERDVTNVEVAGSIPAGGSRFQFPPLFSCPNSNTPRRHGHGCLSYHANSTKMHTR